MNAVRDDGDGIGETGVSDTKGFEVGSGTKASGTMEARPHVEPKGAAFLPGGLA
jgi:hypothetical protein